MAITATIDRNVKVLITKASIRRHLKLGDFKVKTSKARRKAKIVISEDKDAKDPSKQGRSLIEELDMDVDISLVPLCADDQGRTIDDTQVNGQPKDQLGVFSAAKARDKGKAVMQEFNPTKKIKWRIQVQMSIDEELARKLHEEELARFNAQQEAIDIATKEKAISEGDQAHDIDWSDPTVIRYHTLQNKPRCVAEVRKSMYIYLKNQGGFKLSHFKGINYEDIRPIFEKVWDQIHSFVPMNYELEVQR
uniref:Uncharacterized protein n=1 Tax=Tanacetum cinerariifolium TaxID=118510 RepID=A0A6L2M916_TANCI|nr:hypothetical protein [Tanacetum cinerariifolium]